MGLCLQSVWCLFLPSLLWTVVSASYFDENKIKQICPHLFVYQLLIHSGSCVFRDLATGGPTKLGDGCWTPVLFNMKELIHQLWEANV